MAKGMLKPGPLRDAIVASTHAAVRVAIVREAKRHGGDPVLIGEALGVDKSTIMRWVRKLGLTSEMERQRQAKKLQQRSTEKSS